MTKTAQVTGIAALAARFPKLFYGGLGAAGFGLGHTILPSQLGTENSGPAKFIGGAMDAVSLPALVAGVLKGKVNPGLGGVLFAGEQMIPKAIAGMDAAQANAERMPAAMHAAGPVAQISELLRGNTARGAVAGLGAAGAGALLSSTMRRKTDSEELQGTSRAGMFGRDFSRAAIPIALAGGLAGSLIRRDPGQA